MANFCEICELVEQHAVIRFLVSEGEKPVNYSHLFSFMIKQYGQSCMNRRNKTQGKSTW